MTFVVLQKKKWVAEHVVFIDPISYIKPKSEERAKMVNQARRQKMWISDDAVHEPANLRYNTTFRAQRATGEDKVYFMFGLFNGRVFAQRLPDDYCEKLDDTNKFFRDQISEVRINGAFTLFNFQ